MALVRFFDEPSTLEEVGGKAVNLSRLARAGFPVPPGFAVTTEAFHAAIAAHGLRDVVDDAIATADPDDPGSVDRASERIRAAFADAPAATILTEPVAQAVLDAYRQLGGGAVAVRSSATAEDLPDLSFAGQQDTVLGVTDEDALLAAVALCWSSLWTARAITYRRRAGITRGGRGPGGRRAADGHRRHVRRPLHREPAHRSPEPDGHRRDVRPRRGAGLRSGRTGPLPRRRPDRPGARADAGRQGGGHLTAGRRWGRDAPQRARRRGDAVRPRRPRPRGPGPARPGGVRQPAGPRVGHRGGRGRAAAGPGDHLAVPRPPGRSRRRGVPVLRGRPGDARPDHPARRRRHPLHHGRRRPGVRHHAGARDEPLDRHRR